MHVINARNVNEAYVVGLGYLRAYGKEQNSRMGKVLVVDHPVCTTYERPYERVLFNSERDANPFFHFMESLWMLAGRNLSLSGVNGLVLIKFIRFVKC
jgi:hypothetical protein